MPSDLTAPRLRDLMDYDPATGALGWKIKPRRAAQDGQPGYIDDEGYRRIKVEKRNYYAHRLAWLFVHGEWPARQIDHRNGNRADNRLENLRDVTQAVNVQNLHGASAGKRSCNLLGAFAHRPTNRWHSRIRLGGKVISLGYFDTPEEAHAAYLEGKRRIHEGCMV